MERTDIGLLGMAASSILIAVAIGISLWRQLGLERSVLWAALRALVQLIIVGYALQLIVDPDDPLVLSFVWLLFMLGFAAYTTQQRASEVPAVLPLVAGRVRRQRGGDTRRALRFRGL